MVHPVNVADVFDCNSLAGLDKPSCFSLIFLGPGATHSRSARMSGLPTRRNLWTTRVLISKGHSGPYPHGSCVAV